MYISPVFSYPVTYSFCHEDLVYCNTVSYHDLDTRYSVSGVSHITTCIILY